MKSSLMQKHEYYTMYKTEKNMWWNKGLRDLLQYHLSQKGQKLRILDAGCGTGMNIKFLLSKGHLAYGIDLSTDAVALCKKRRLKTAKKGSILNIPFCKNYFDTVICIDVLGSMTSDQNIQKALEEFYRVLKPNGLLLIHCAALPWLRSPHDAVTNFRVRFLKDKLKSYVSYSHWNILKCSYRVFFLFPIVASIKLIKKILWKIAGDNTDQTLTPYILNQAFFSIQLIENRLLRFIDFPIGSSIILVAKKLYFSKNPISNI
ncbi:MAG: class I SAM-dependent methyltransferase [Patescibacteria group bacterium]